jgi:hypothetical protein
MVTQAARTIHRLLLPGAAALMLLLGACEGVTPVSYSSDIDALLSGGDRYARSLQTASPENLSTEEVVVLGYLERARLGLGSPFRLAEYATRDRRLAPEVRQAAAYAVLSAVLRGEAYEIPAEVLDPLSLAGNPPGTLPGAEHLRLIEEAIRTAPTARSGERAVRLAYLLSTAERTVLVSHPSVVAHVAALVADRRMAREDAQRLLRAAASQQRDPLELMVEWRRGFRFALEQPALDPLSLAELEAEATLAPRLALTIRATAQRLSVPATLVGRRRGFDVAQQRWLNVATGERLLAIAKEHDYPPQAPVAVAVSINRDPLVERPGLTALQRAVRESFVDEAWSEERLTAAAAILRGSGAGFGPRAPLIAVQAAVFLRGWHQEEPWFPGDPAPAEKDLRARFGLAGIEFDAEVPETWRPYYRRMLGRSLSELQRVLPTASVRGMTVRFGAVPEGTRALALHVPQRRTLVLPPATGAGTLAHEVAHDLDWQLALRRYNVRGGYATDIAVRGRSGDRLATSLQGLSASLVRHNPDLPMTAHETRPAEVFARATDWFVAASLAREGRSGGYLTSFQDPALTGYGTTRGPDVAGNAVPTLLAILEQVAPVPESTRSWVMDQYGPSRTISSKEVVTAILEAGTGSTAWGRFIALEQARLRILRTLDEATCDATQAEGLRRLWAAQRTLVQSALAAAAQGAIVDGTREVATALLPVDLQSGVDGWIAWRLYGAPAPADSTFEALAAEFDALRVRSQQALGSKPEVRASAFDLGPTPAPCGGNPFAYPSARPSNRSGGLEQGLQTGSSQAEPWISILGEGASWRAADPHRQRSSSRWQPDSSRRPDVTRSAR